MQEMKTMIKEDNMTEITIFGHNCNASSLFEEAKYLHNSKIYGNEFYVRRYKSGNVQTELQYVTGSYQEVLEHAEKFLKNFVS